MGCDRFSYPEDIRTDFKLIVDLTNIELIAVNFSIREVGICKAYPVLVDSKAEAVGCL